MDVIKTRFVKTELVFNIKHLFQVDNSGRTPLMAAALSGSDTSVELLLKHGADPNRVDEQGRTALTAAIMGGVNTTIRRLAQVTKGVEGSDILGTLARYHQQVKFSEPLDNFVKKNTDDLVFRLGQACYYGATDLFNSLLQSENPRGNFLQLSLLQFLVKCPITRILAELFFDSLKVPLTHSTTK